MIRLCLRHEPLQLFHRRRELFRVCGVDVDLRTDPIARLSAAVIIRNNNADFDRAFLQLIQIGSKVG